MLSEATSEMSPLPKFEVMGREVRAKGVLSGSNYQWFNRLIKDDEPYRWTGLSVELRRSRRDRPTWVLSSKPPMVRSADQG